MRQRWRRPEGRSEAELLRKEEVAARRKKKRRRCIKSYTFATPPQTPRPRRRGTARIPERICERLPAVAGEGFEATDDAIVVTKSARRHNLQRETHQRSSRCAILEEVANLRVEGDSGSSQLLQEFEEASRIRMTPRHKENNGQYCDGRYSR